MPQAIAAIPALLGPAFAAGTVGGLVASTAITLGISIGICFIPARSLNS